MSNDSVFIQKAFNRAGFAKMEAWDSVSSCWRPMCRTKDVEVSIASDKYDQMEVFGGKRYKTQRRTAGETCNVKFTLTESMAPEVIKFLVSDYTQTQTATGSLSSITPPTIGTNAVGHPMYGTDSYPVDSRSGVASQANLAPTFTVAATQVASGGSAWTTGANYFWVVPIYGTISFAASPFTTYNSFMDITGKYTAGTPVQITGSSINIGSATNTITTTITLSSLGKDKPLPDAWAVFQATSNSIAAARLNGGAANTITRAQALAGSGNTQAIAFFTKASGSSDLYVVAKGIAIEAMTTYSTGTVTFTKAVEGTDYTYDVADGTATDNLYARIDASTVILNGQDVRVSQWFIQPPSIVTNVGAGRANSALRKLRFITLESEVNPVSGEIVLTEGLEIILNSVDVMSLGATFNFTEAQFENGHTVNYEALHDGTRKFGTITARSRKFYNWVQNYNLVTP